MVDKLQALSDDCLHDGSGQTVDPARCTFLSESFPSIISSIWTILEGTTSSGNVSGISRTATILCLSFIRQSGNPAV